jgi:hypothetical protein
MSFLTSNKNYADVPAAGASDTVAPNSILPSRVGKAIQTKHKMISIASSNGASTKASGLLLFNIPGQGYLKSGSVYLKFQFRALTTAAANYGFNTYSGSAATCFNRVSLSVGAGNNIETINNYNLFHDLLMSHCASRDYTTIDCGITEGCNRENFVSGANLAASTEYFFTVPIASSVFQNAKDFPLFLTNGLTLQIDLETASRALTAGLDYEITNAILCAEILTPDESFLATLRNEMVQSNKLYEIPLVSCQSLQTSRQAGADLNFMAGVNLSSVLSVFWAEIRSTVDQGSGTKFVINPMSALQDDKRYDRNILVDGEKRIAYAIQSNSMVYQELQRCISGLSDYTCTSIADYATYGSNSFWNGLSFQKYKNTSVCMRGSPMGNMILNVQSSGQNPNATNCYIYIVYDSVLVISPATGSVVVAK